MSLHSYERSGYINEDFDTIIMAAMRKADTMNLHALRASWPEIFTELEERYNAPGGFTASERDARLRHSDSTKPKIFVMGSPGGLRQGDYIGYALAEDGAGLGSHLCSNLNFVMHDMGVISDSRHDDYKNHYPDGYQLIWLGEWPEEGNHPEFDIAVERNKAIAAAKELAKEVPVLMASSEEE